MGCEDLVLEFPFVPFLYPCFSNVPFQSLCYSWVFQNPTPCKSFRGLHPEIKGHFSSEAAESLFFMILPHALSKDFFLSGSRWRGHSLLNQSWHTVHNGVQSQPQVRNCVAINERFGGRQNV